MLTSNSNDIYRTDVTTNIEIGELVLLVHFVSTQSVINVNLHLIHTFLSPFYLYILKISDLLKNKMKLRTLKSFIKSH